MVECEDRTSSSHKTFAKVAFQFMKSLSEQSDGTDRRGVFKRQAELVGKLQNMSREIRNMRGDRGKKIERLRQSIRETGWETMESLPLFLDASVDITGIIAGIFPQPDTQLILDDASVFKSSLSPLRINLKTSDPEKSIYPIIFKTGDDLRQDQLVIQIVSLMDKLLLKENLDLKLTPYKIIATGVDHGAVQFIESVSLNAAIAKGGSILGYLRNNNPSHGAEYGVRKEVMETYIRSCGIIPIVPNLIIAGYCVVTYLLGVGDRHLDNLLLSPDGHFFHADFGYILGRDPKPFPAQMKLSREMVDGMGGTSSPYYAQFKSFCFTAYTTLRKSANLILNLFSLMVDANIPDILFEPDKAVLKVNSPGYN
jgi:phosphatidylinositol 3-kinase